MQDNNKNSAKIASVSDTTRTSDKRPYAAPKLTIRPMKQTIQGGMQNMAESNSGSLS